MSQPKLYVELNGPILIPHEHPDPVLQAGIADYAKSFMHWATQHFDVHWLTDRSPGDAFYVANKLALPSDKVSVRGFEVSKVEALHPNENFYWVDSELIPDEVAWLAKHEHFNRFVSVDPLKGVTPEHKKMLEDLLKVHNRA